VLEVSKTQKQKKSQCLPVKDDHEKEDHMENDLEDYVTKYAYCVTNYPFYVVIS